MSGCVLQTHWHAHSSQREWEWVIFPFHRLMRERPLLIRTLLMLRSYVLKVDARVRSTTRLMDRAPSTSLSEPEADILEF